MDKNDVKDIICNALTHYLLELNLSCYDKTSTIKVTSECIAYLNSNPIDEQWILNNHLVVYPACCCYHKSLDDSIKDARISSNEKSLAKYREEREVIIRLKMVYEKQHLDINIPLL